MNETSRRSDYRSILRIVCFFDITSVLSMIIPHVGLNTSMNFLFIPGNLLILIFRMYKTSGRSDYRSILGNVCLLVITLVLSMIIPQDCTYYL